MRILFYSPDDEPEAWIAALAKLLPEARVDIWRDGEGTPAPDAQPAAQHADYALLWRPSAAVLAACRGVKAIFNLGAGVDAVFKAGVPPPAPLVRLDDAGMGVQMAEYVSYALLRYFRRFDEYQLQAASQQWHFLEPYRKSDFTVGILGLGVLGLQVAAAVRQFGFPLRAWSRSKKDVAGIECFAGTAELDAFLSGTRVLVCVLPLTAETANILNRRNLSRLPHGAYLINVARGGHVAEPDLLALIRSGQIAGATLDVFRNEPLPAQHPFWQEPRITITPHMAAQTLVDESIAQIVAKIGAIERGESIAGIVDYTKGY